MTTPPSLSPPRDRHRSRARLLLLFGAGQLILLLLLATASAPSLPVSAQLMTERIFLPVVLTGMDLRNPSPSPVLPTRTRRPRPTRTARSQPATLTPSASSTPEPTLTSVPRATPPTPSTPPVGPTPALGPDDVRTSHGPVRGVREGVGDSSVLAFRGIPYAAPPTGQRRWRLPEPPAPWSAVREARAFGAVCPQYESDAVVGDEDCLTLNVWAPAAEIDGLSHRYGADPRVVGDPNVEAVAEGPLPVLVWIHGGGHEQGSSAVMAGDRALYDGRDLAGEHGLVVVTINYRLGPFGFLAHPDLTTEGGRTASGNYGMHDQLLALRWVHDNAAAFGGDPGRVTIAGQSAGAVSVCRLIASPLAEGLFHRAILQSGGCPATPLDRAEANGRRVAQDAGCDAAPDVPACLRDRSTAEIMATHSPLEGGGTESLGRNAYDGVIDGYAVPEAPGERIAAGRHHPVPVIVGATSAENGRSAPPIADEAAFEAAVRAYFVRSGLPAALADRAIEAYPVADYPTPRDAYVALTSDLKFACTARNDARRFHAAQSEPVWRYWYDHVAENVGALARNLGAYHGAELPFLFGVLDFQTRAGRYVPGPGDLAVSAAMQGYWARFAATGDPNGSGAVGGGAGGGSGNGDALAWPRYDLEREPALRFAAPTTIVARVRGAQCDFWAAPRWSGPPLLLPWLPRGVMPSPPAAMPQLETGAVALPSVGPDTPIPPPPTTSAPAVADDAATAAILASSPASAPAGDPSDVAAPDAAPEAPAVEVAPTGPSSAGLVDAATAPPGSFTAYAQAILPLVQEGLAAAERDGAVLEATENDPEALCSAGGRSHPDLAADAARMPDIYDRIVAIQPPAAAASVVHEPLLESVRLWGEALDDLNRACGTDEPLRQGLERVGAVLKMGGAILSFQSARAGFERLLVVEGLDALADALRGGR